jgi:hypothetical protein
VPGPRRQVGTSSNYRFKSALPDEKNYIRVSVRKIVNFLLIDVKIKVFLSNKRRR